MIKIAEHFPPSSLQSQCVSAINWSGVSDFPTLTVDLAFPALELFPHCVWKDNSLFMLLNFYNQPCNIKDVTATTHVKDKFEPVKEISFTWCSLQNSYSEFLWIHWSSASPMSPVNCLWSSSGFLFSIIGVCVSGVNHILQT